MGDTSHTARRFCASSDAGVPLSLEGFDGSGADFPARFKGHICDGESVICSPHKVYGSATNDLILQLRRRRINQIVLAGPVGNLCVEAHMRDFIEHGFEVAMVRDATAGTTNEEGDGYTAAMVNWRFMAHALWTTQQTLDQIAAASGQCRQQAGDLAEAVWAGGR